MKKILLAALLAAAIPASAQVVPFGTFGGGGGSIGSGTALSGCTSSLVYATSGSLLGCNPASVVNGSVSTAGRSILTIKDTISGSSATSNFLNVTGTFANSASAAMYGLYFPLTAPSTTGAFPINGIRLSLDYSGAFSETQTAGIVVTNVATNAGGASPFALAVTTEPTSVGIYGSGPYVGAGVYGAVVGGSTGARGAGVIGKVIGNANTANGFGGIFTAQGSTGAGENIGLAAVLAGATSDTQGLATLPATDVALLADNGSVAANIFEARDNGTAVFTVADGGAVTSTANIGITIGAGSFLPGNNGNTLGGLGANSVFTPDAPFYFTGSLSNSLNLLEAGDVGGFDFQNPCTTGLGTAACTDPTLIVHSHNQDTGEFLSMAHDGKAGVIAGGNSTVLDGLIRLGGTVTLTESSATTVLTIPIPVSTGSGGFINYVVDARDATNVQVRTGNVSFAVANTSGGTETCNVFGVGPTTQAAGGDTTNPANPTQVQDGSGVGAITSGTLTYAWSVDTSGSNSCVLKLNAVSSLTQTTLQVHYTVISTGPAIVTGG